MHQFLKCILGMKLYMFRTVPLTIIRSFSLYTQQWYVLDLLTVCEQEHLLLLTSCQQTCITYTVAVCPVKNC